MQQLTARNYQFFFNSRAHKFYTANSYDSQPRSISTATICVPLQNSSSCDNPLQTRCYCDTGSKNSSPYRKTLTFYPQCIVNSRFIPVFSLHLRPFLRDSVLDGFQLHEKFLAPRRSTLSLWAGCRGQGWVHQRRFRERMERQRQRWLGRRPQCRHARRDRRLCSTSRWSCCRRLLCPVELRYRYFHRLFQLCRRLPQLCHYTIQWHHDRSLSHQRHKEIKNTDWV